MRIIVADDAATLRATFSWIVRRLGHDIVAEAADAGEAERLTLALKPDVVVVDGRLAGIELPATIARLADLAPAILVVTALEERRLGSAALAAGATGLLLRPFSVSGISAALRRSKRGEA